MKLKVLGFLGIALIVLASYKNEKKLELNEVKFYDGSYDELLRESRKQKKPIILEFWATWCIPCRKLENETFANPDFAAYINKNFLVYKVNIDTFDGMEIADRYNIDAYPTLVQLDIKNKYVNRYKGVFPAYYLKKELEKNKSRTGKDFITSDAVNN
ncbi:thioredoxin family protein [Emticicia sp. C21]|uniref:thioredoxin family protein n=1 Tax=Emticicia sp. C21 TaxID=2302915 RepID=UPI000E34BEFB|nr:thioredoxin family protein [Emticicia sp. C21]RFS15898.1 thioredoxin family protein [Emticicia sp. C21]